MDEFQSQLGMRIRRLREKRGFTQESFADACGLHRNFMGSVPLITGGFETETELTLQALEKGMVIREMPIRYRARTYGETKISRFQNGAQLLRMTAYAFLKFRSAY